MEKFVTIFAAVMGIGGIIFMVLISNGLFHNYQSKMAIRAGRTCKFFGNPMMGLGITGGIILVVDSYKFEMSQGALGALSLLLFVFGYLVNIGFPRSGWNDISEFGDI